jgi:hypothetical protein
MEPIVWKGDAENPTGLTPFGFYDSDVDFVIDAPKVADWCARRLGYPTMDVELIDKHFYACFEEAITEYGHQVNQWSFKVGHEWGKISRVSQLLGLHCRS